MFLSMKLSLTTVFVLKDRTVQRTFVDLDLDLEIF